MMDRNSNVELLRIVAMFFIIFHHLIVHGLGLKSLATSTYLSNQTFPFLPFLLNSFLIIGPNIFLLITGYFSIKNGLLQLYKIYKIAFYCGIVVLLSDFIFSENYSLKQILLSLFPLAHGGWYVLNFTFLLLLSDLLNSGWRSFNNAQKRNLVVFLLIISCYYGFIWRNDSGYSFMQMLTMYFIGRYLHDIDVLHKIKNPLFVYFLFSFSVFIGAFSLFHLKQSLSWHFFSYSNPLIILSSISFFLFFLKLNFSNRYINKIALSVFSIYLIHDSVYFRNLIGKLSDEIVLRNNGISEFLIFILLGVSIFIICLFIDQFRRLLNRYSEKYFRPRDIIY
ncbi:MAG: acyltransferase family protein [Bacteroidales bacterium]